MICLYCLPEFEYPKILDDAIGITTEVCPVCGSSDIAFLELIDISEDEYLISVALNRRYLSEGQKAVLANEYKKVISERALKERGLKGALVTNKSLYGIEDERLSVTVSDKRTETDTRKLAAKKFNVSECKVREVQGIDTKAVTETRQRKRFMRGCIVSQDSLYRGDE